MRKMVTTCGCFLIFNGNLLIIHPTWSNLDIWDIPKGLCEKNESHEDAMYREMYEETNIVLADYQHYLFDIGFNFYRSGKKRIHGFVAILKEWNYPDIYCKSTFNKDDYIISEIDAFSWKPIEEAIGLLPWEKSDLFLRNTEKFFDYV